MVENPRVSIVLPAYNEEKTVEHCVHSLLNQSFKNREIIVVDDGSTDQTPSILEKLSEADPELQIIRFKHNQGRPKALNTGARTAKGEIIAYAEADAQYHANWLENSLKHFNDPNVAGVLGPRYCWQTDSILRRIIDYSLRIRYDNPTFQPPGAFIFRKSILQRLGGFDEQLPEAEDRDIALRIRDSGYQLIFEKNSIWWHTEHKTLKDYITFMFTRTKNHTKFFAKNSHDIPYYKVFILLGYLLLAVLFIVTKNFSLLLLLIGLIPVAILAQTIRIYNIATKGSVKIDIVQIVAVAGLDFVKNIATNLAIVVSLGDIIKERSRFQ